MKNKSNEWISVTDLMSGVMAVVMLLLVVSVVQKAQADFKHKLEEEKIEETRKKSVFQILSDIKMETDGHAVSELIKFNFKEGRMTLDDGLFDKGSACVPSQIVDAFDNIHSILEGFLADNSTALIYIEGHTDSLPVSQPVTNYKKYCTVYDDNFTLSAARAREARNLLVSSLDADQSSRIIVAGYGDSRLIKGIDPKDGKNRRVEIRFSIPTSL